MKLIAWKGYWVYDNNIPLSRAGVYSLLERETGKRYIGATDDVRKRFNYHKKKYGTGSFIAEPLWYSLSSNKPALLDVERRLIEIYDTTHTGYNLLPGAGAPQTSIVKKKRVQARKAFYQANPDMFLIHQSRAVEGQRTDEARNRASLRTKTSRAGESEEEKKRRNRKISESLRKRWAEGAYSNRNASLP